MADIRQWRTLFWTTATIVPKPHRLDENLDAAKVERTPDDLREIETATSKITVQGARYAESSQRLIDR